MSRTLLQKLWDFDRRPQGNTMKHLGSQIGLKHRGQGETE